MSAHAAMPKSAWVFPALAVLLFAAVTATGYGFTPSAVGLLFATVATLFFVPTVFATVRNSKSTDSPATNDLHTA